MTEFRNPLDTYESFFRDQVKRKERLDLQRNWSVGLVAVALLLLLGFLRSPWWVWVFVTGLYVLTVFGLYRAARALYLLEKAFDDLKKLVDCLKESPKLEEVRLKFGALPNDECNVPEAILSLTSGNRSGESIRSAANAAFVQPISKLALVHYLRSLLILGGLFGTVFFFAIELGRGGILQGNLSELLPGLRGALASTLTGILGSIALGLLVSETDQLVEESVWETEGLFGGPLSTALSKSTEDPKILNETMLWQSLVEQVRALRSDTVESYSRLANDVNAYALALREVSAQLNSLPQVQVPPQLARLQDVVSEFARGTEVLNSAAVTLVDAVGKVGLVVPTRMIESLAELRNDMASTRSEVRSNVTDLKMELLQSSAELAQSVTRSIATMELAIEGAKSQQLAVIGAEAERVHARLEIVGVDVQAVKAELSASSKNAGSSVVTPSGLPSSDENSNGLSSLRSDLAAVRTLVEELPARIPEALGNIDSASSLRIEFESIHGIESLVREQDSRLWVLATDLGEMKQSLARAASRLGRVEQMATWLERANRAPLMRLLTLPWRRVRSDGVHGASS